MVVAQASISESPQSKGSKKKKKKTLVNNLPEESEIRGYNATYVLARDILDHVFRGCSKELCNKEKLIDMISPREQLSPF